MSLNLKPIISLTAADIEYNFQQIVLHGGGPRGPRGLLGPPGMPGPVGKKGNKGDTGARGSRTHFIANLTEDSEFEDLLEYDWLVEQNTRRYYQYVGGEWVQEGDFNFFEEGVAGLIHFVPEAYGNIVEPPPVVATAKTNYSVLVSSIFDNEGVPTPAAIDSPEQILQSIAGSDTSEDLNLYRVKIYTGNPDPDSTTGVYDGGHLHLANAPAMCHDDAWLQGSGFALSSIWDGALAETLTFTGIKAEDGHTHTVEFRDTGVLIGDLNIKESGWISVNPDLNYTPLVPIDINDGIKIGSTVIEAPGVIRYHSGIFQGYTGTGWIDFGGSTGITISDGTGSSDTDGPIFIQGGRIGIGTDDTYCATLTVAGGINIGPHIPDDDNPLTCDGTIQFFGGQLQLRKNGEWVNISTGMRINDYGYFEGQDDEGNWIAMGSFAAAANDDDMEIPVYSAIRIKSSTGTIKVTLEDMDIEEGVAVFDLTGAGSRSYNHNTEDFNGIDFGGIGLKSSDCSVTITPLVEDTVVDELTGELLPPFAVYDLSFNVEKQLINLISTDGSVKITKREPDACDECDRGITFDLSCLCGQSSSDDDCLVIRSTVFVNDDAPLYTITLTEDDEGDIHSIAFPVNKFGSDFVESGAPFQFVADANTAGKYQINTFLLSHPSFTYTDADETIVRVKQWLYIMKNGSIYSNIDYVEQYDSFNNMGYAALRGSDVVDLEAGDILEIGIKGYASTELSAHRFFDGWISMFAVPCSSSGGGRASDTDYAHINVLDADGEHMFYLDADGADDYIDIVEGAGITLEKYERTNGRYGLKISVTGALDDPEPTNGSDYDWRYIHLRKPTGAYITKTISAKKADDILVIEHGTGIKLEQLTDATGFKISLDVEQTLNDNDYDWRYIKLYNINEATSAVTNIATVEAIKNDDTVGIYAGEGIRIKRFNDGFIISATGGADGNNGNDGSDGEDGEDGGVCNVLRYKMSTNKQYTQKAVATYHKATFQTKVIEGEGTITTDPFSFSPKDAVEGRYHINTRLIWSLMQKATGGAPGGPYPMSVIYAKLVVLKNGEEYSTLDTYNKSFDGDFDYDTAYTMDMQGSDIIELGAGDKVEIAVYYILNISASFPADVLNFIDGYATLNLIKCAASGGSVLPPSNTGDGEGSGTGGCETGVFTTAGSPTNYSVSDDFVWILRDFTNVERALPNVEYGLGKEWSFTPADGVGGVYHFSVIADFDLSGSLSAMEPWATSYSTGRVALVALLQEDVDGTWVNKAWDEIDFIKRYHAETDNFYGNTSLTSSYIKEIKDGERLRFMLAGNCPNISELTSHQMNIAMHKIACSTSGGGSGECTNVVEDLFYASNSSLYREFEFDVNDTGMTPELLSAGVLVREGLGGVVDTTPLTFTAPDSAIGEYDINGMIQIRLTPAEDQTLVPSTFYYTFFVLKNGVEEVLDQYVGSGNGTSNSTLYTYKFNYRTTLDEDDTIQFGVHAGCPSAGAPGDVLVLQELQHQFTFEEVSNPCDGFDISHMVFTDGSTSSLIGRFDAVKNSSTVNIQIGDNLTGSMINEDTIRIDAVIPECEINAGVYTTNVDEEEGDTFVDYADIFNPTPSSWPTSTHLSGPTLYAPLRSFSNIQIESGSTVVAEEDENLEFTPGANNGGKYHFNLLVDWSGAKQFTDTDSVVLHSGTWSARISLFSYINGVEQDELEFWDTGSLATSITTTGNRSFTASYIYELGDEDTLSFKIKVVDTNASLEKNFFRYFQVNQSNFSIFKLACGGSGGGTTIINPPGNDEDPTPGTIQVLSCNVGDYKNAQQDWIEGLMRVAVVDFKSAANIKPSEIPLVSQVIGADEGTVQGFPTFSFLAGEGEGTYQVNAMVEMTLDTVNPPITTLATQEYELWLMRNGVAWQMLDARRWTSVYDSHVWDEAHICLGNSTVIDLNETDTLSLGIRVSTDLLMAYQMIILPESYLSFHKIACGATTTGIAGGSGGAGNFVGGRFWNNDVQMALDTTEQRITFVTEDFANGVSMLTSSKLKVAAAGIYRVDLRVNGNMDTSGQRIIFVYKNGSSSGAWNFIQHNASEGNRLWYSASDLFNLQANDYIEFVFYSSTEGNFSGGVVANLTYEGSLP
jgi:hypothetical protein